MLLLYCSQRAVLRAGLYVYDQSEYEEKGLSGAELADKDLKAVLEGLAKHLFGDVEVSLKLNTLENAGKYILMIIHGVLPGKEADHLLAHITPRALYIKRFMTVT